MINLWAFIAIAASTFAVVLLYAALAVADANKQLRAWNDELLATGNEVIANFDALEARNRHLEAMAVYHNDLRVGSVLTIVMHAHGEKEMVAREEAP